MQIIKQDSNSTTKDCFEFEFNTCKELQIVGDFPGSPVVRTLPSNAGGVGLILGQGVKIPHASGPKNQNRKQKQYRKKFNKDLKKNGPRQKFFKK